MAQEPIGFPADKNFTIGTTSYFTNPDGLPDEVSGDAQPYPITIQTSPVFVGSYGIEIPPDTDWDFTYFLSNSFWGAG